MAPLLSYPPVATISIGPLHLFTWGIFVALGVLAGAYVAKRRARRAGISDMIIIDFTVWVFVAGIIGARLLFIIEYWKLFIHAPWHVFALWEGGMSIYGSIVLAAIAGWWFCRRRHLDLPTLFRIVAPALLFGDAIARLGGASSHMYPGTPTRFLLSYMLDGVQRHEVGIELSLISMLGFCVVLGIERWLAAVAHSHDTRVIWRYSPALVILWYSFERFFLDFLRAYDLPTADYRYAGLTLAQYFAVLGMVIGVMMLMRTPKITSATAT